MSTDVLRAQLAQESRLLAREEALRSEGRLVDLIEAFAARRPPGASAYDNAAVADLLRDARRHPREIRRANVVSADITGDTRQPSTMPSPFSLWTAPLLDAFAVDDPQTGARLHAEWPTGIQAGPQTAEKVELPTTAFSIGAADNDGTVYGLALNVSRYIDLLLDAGRAGLIGDYLTAQARAAADAALAAAIEAQAGTAADLSAAVAAIVPPYQPSYIVGNLADLLDIDAQRLGILGLEIVVDQNMTQVVVADWVAIDASTATIGLLAQVEPALVGTMMSAAVKLSARIDAAGWVAVTAS